MAEVSKVFQFESIKYFIIQTDVASAGSAFKDTRKVKVLSIQRPDVNKLLTS